MEGFWGRNRFQKLGAAVVGHTVQATEYMSCCQLLQDSVKFGLQVEHVPFDTIEISHWASFNSPFSVSVNRH